MKTKQILRFIASIVAVTFISTQCGLGVSWAYAQDKGAPACRQAGNLRPEGTEGNVVGTIKGDFGVQSVKSESAAIGLIRKWRISYVTGVKAVKDSEGVLGRVSRKDIAGCVKHIKRIYIKDMFSYGKICKIYSSSQFKLVYHPALEHKELVEAGHSEVPPDPYADRRWEYGGDQNPPAPTAPVWVESRYKTIIDKPEWIEVVPVEQPKAKISSQNVLQEESLVGNLTVLLNEINNKLPFMLNIGSPSDESRSSTGSAVLVSWASAQRDIKPVASLVDAFSREATKNPGEVSRERIQIIRQLDAYDISTAEARFRQSLEGSDVIIDHHSDALQVIKSCFEELVNLRKKTTSQIIVVILGANIANMQATVEQSAGVVFTPGTASVGLDAMLTQIGMSVSTLTKEQVARLSAAAPEMVEQELQKIAEQMKVETVRLCKLSSEDIKTLKTEIVEIDPTEINANIAKILKRFGVTFDDNDPVKLEAARKAFEAARALSTGV